jgi:hypothetical protein
MVAVMTVSACNTSSSNAYICANMVEVYVIAVLMSTRPEKRHYYVVFVMLFTASAACDMAL